MFNIFERSRIRHTDRHCIVLFCYDELTTGSCEQEGGQMIVCLLASGLPEPILDSDDSHVASSLQNFVLRNRNIGTKADDDDVNNSHEE